MLDFDLNKWSLIPGPEFDPPATSLHISDLVEYPPSAIAEAILEFPGMLVQNRGTPTWWDWSAIWQTEMAIFEVGMTLFETEPVLWGGSPFQGFCSADDILSLWESVRRRCPGVWLHNDDCEIHTPESFKNLFIPRSQAHS